MKYIVTFFWSFILGQIVYYLGSSLTRAQYDLVGGTILAFVITIVVAIVARIMESVQGDSSQAQPSNKAHS